MTSVATYAVPTPDTSTPSAQACGVSVGSWPMVWVNTQPAATDTTNWKTCMTGHFSKESA